MKNWFNKFIVWLFPSDEVEYIGLTDKEASGFVNVATEDKNEAPLLELVESLRAQLAIVTEDRDRLRFESIFMSEYNSTCAHHTYEERKTGCPVCLKRKLEEAEKPSMDSPANQAHTHDKETT